MEDTLFDNTLKRIEYVFRLAGVNIRTKPQKPSAIFKSRLVFVNQWIWLNIDLCGAIYWFIDGLVFSGKEFLELTYIAPCISLTALSSLKVILLMVKEKTVHKLIYKMRELEYKEKERKPSKVKTEMMESERNFLHITLSTITILYILAVFFFTISPFILMWLNYRQTNELILILPFLILYPFDPFNMKVYPFVYMHQFWSELIVLFNTGSADFFFFTCTTYIRIQFKLLQHHIHELFTNKDSNSNYKAEIKNIVMWHQDLIDCANMLEDIFTYSTLLNYISSSITICLTGFNVTKVPDLTIIFNFIFLLIFGLVQVFFLCYFADLLLIASEEVAAVVYNSNWVGADLQTVKCLLIIKTRAQTPCRLTAAGFADVNLNSFMRILSTSWSYFALLQTLYGD